MSTTWVAIRGHGVVEVQPLPEFIKEFLVKVLPPSYAEEGHFESFAPASSFDCGKEIYRVPVGPIQPAALLKERIFETTLEDANLVGNIYFSNYYLWQGRVRDHYMNEIAPEYFSGSGKQGELRCMQCKVNHINEAMPFDGIAVRMYRTAVYERGITFYFDYYRVGSDGDRKKLGHGEHSAVWFAPTKENKWVPSALPQNILDALLPEKSPANPVSTPAPQSGSNGKYDVIIVSSRT
jgi:acyl-CoA thioesterase FadM